MKAKVLSVITIVAFFAGLFYLASLTPVSEEEYTTIQSFATAVLILTSTTGITLLAWLTIRWILK